MGYRIEKDSMGELQIPDDAYYGAQTQRAVNNFPISGLRMPSEFIRMLALVKKCAAKANLDLGLLDEKVADAIVAVAGELAEGGLSDQFPVDVFQTGSGTSTNMNMNEVLAGRANEILTGNRGGRDPVHPNDHVNRGQSSNDVIPTVLHASALVEIRKKLIPALDVLKTALEEKSEEFAGIKKIGRTHLQDAVPITLGQEFSAYARQVELGMDRLKAMEPRLAELALGGTAVGTGLNTHPEFAGKAIGYLSSETGVVFDEAANHFEAQGAQDGAVEASGVLKTVAISLHKIANDIRWLGSGPRFGLGEILLPELQPGSSIMPGKVNPVQSEVMVQVAGQVIGNDAAIAVSGISGYFELNTMLPLIAYNLLQSIDLLAAASRTFAEKCVAGIRFNEGSPATDLERSLSMATHLVPAVGYDQAAALAKEAYKSGKNVREVAMAKGLVSEEELDKLFSEK